MDKVPMDYEVDGISMSLDTWRSLQDVRGTQIFNDIENLAKRFVADNKFFLIYDHNNSEVMSRCDNTKQVDDLFHPPATDAT